MQRRVYTNQMLIRGIAKVLVETVYSIVVFKIVVFFASLKEELQHKSTPEMLELLGYQNIFFCYSKCFFWGMVIHLRNSNSDGNSEQFSDIISTVAKRALKRSRDGA